MFSLNGGAPCPTSCHSTQHDSAQLSATDRIVTQWAPARPTTLRNRPATIAPASGASAITSRTVLEIKCSTPGMPSALQRIDAGHVDRAPVAEQGDQDRQADRGLGRGHGQDEEHEHLSRGVAQVARERDEVDVHRQQQQLDAHQQHDHVLAVDEDARDRDAEQDRAQGEEMSEGQAGGHGAHALVSVSVSSAGASIGGRTGSIFTRRKRSAARTRDCSAGSWWRAPGRRRRVSTTAAITATVRITAAVSNGSRKSVNSERASQVVLPGSPSATARAALSANGTAARPRTPISTRISASIATATTNPTGRKRT